MQYDLKIYKSPVYVARTLKERLGVIKYLCSISNKNFEHYNRDHTQPLCTESGLIFLKYSVSLDVTFIAWDPIIYLFDYENNGHVIIDTWKDLYV